MAFPTTIANIERAEHGLGRRLPAPLRDRLLVDNGGEVETDGYTWQLHPVWDDTNRRTIARTTSHIVHETNEARSMCPHFPVDAIAIASDGSGNYLVVRSGSDVIEDWFHETGECSPVTVDWNQ